MAKPALNTPPALPATESDLKELGRQLTEQYERAELATLEIVAFGAMMMEFEAIVSTRENNSGQKAGRYVKGTGLKPALAKYAPDVSYAKAYRHCQIAKALKTELSLKSAEQLRLIATTETKPKLDPKLAKKRERLVDLVADKSVRGLQAELGLADETRSHTPAKKLTPEEKRKQWIEAARGNAIAAFDSLLRVEERWKLLDDDQLALAQKTASKLAKEIERWLATAAKDRAALQLEKYLGEEDAT